MTGTRAGCELGWNGSDGRRCRHRMRTDHDRKGEQNALGIVETGGEEVLRNTWSNSQSVDSWMMSSSAGCRVDGPHFRVVPGASAQCRRCDYLYYALGDLPESKFTHKFC